MQNQKSLLKSSAHITEQLNSQLTQNSWSGHQNSSSAISSVCHYAANPTSTHLHKSMQNLHKHTHTRACAHANTHTLKPDKEENVEGCHLYFRLKIKITYTQQNFSSFIISGHHFHGIDCMKTPTTFSVSTALPVLQKKKQVYWEQFKLRCSHLQCNCNWIFGQHLFWTLTQKLWLLHSA